MVNDKKQQGVSVKIDNETYKKILDHKNKNYVPISKIIKLSVDEYMKNRG